MFKKRKTIGRLQRAIRHIVSLGRPTKRDQYAGLGSLIRLTAGLMVFAFVFTAFIIVIPNLKTHRTPPENSSGDHPVMIGSGGSDTAEITASDESLYTHEEKTHIRETLKNIIADSGAAGSRLSNETRGRMVNYLNQIARSKVRDYSRDGERRKMIDELNRQIREQLLGSG